MNITILEEHREDAKHALIWGATTNNFETAVAQAIANAAGEAKARGMCRGTNKAVWAVQRHVEALKNNYTPGETAHSALSDVLAWLLVEFGADE